MKFIKCGFPLVFFLCVSCLHAQIYKLSPNSAFELGKGIDLRKVDQGKVYALFKNITPIWENETGTPSTSVYEQIISSEQDYQSSRGMDLNLSARYMGASLDASYQSNKQEILNSSSLTLSFVAASDFGRQVLKKMVPGDMESAPAALIAEGKYDLFVQQYGNYFVNAVRRTASITVYLIITSVKRETKSSIASTVKGSYSSGPGTGFSASASLSSEVAEAIRQGRTMINIQSSGDSSGFAGLRDLLTDALKQTSPMDKIAETIRNYIGQFKRENSIISEYHLTPMTSLNIPRQYIAWDEATNGRIVDLYLRYNELQKVKENYQSLLTDNTFIAIATDNDRNAINKTLENLNRDMFYLSKRKDSCLYECQSSNDIYSCCEYDIKYFQPNPIFNKYWNYYSILNHVYNYPSVLKKADTLVLVNAPIPELNGKRIKVNFRYAFNLPSTEYWWASYLGGRFTLLINDKPYEGLFSGRNLIPSYVYDENGTLLPDPRMYEALSTDAIFIRNDTLNIKLVLVDFLNGSFTGQVTYKPADGPIRLLPGNSIKIELVK